MIAADLLIYADYKRQLHAAGSLIVFGAEQIKRTKLIQGLPFLEECNVLLHQKLPYNRGMLVQEFAWEYLIDCVRILIFFEGYMKAELIIKIFCVHNLNKEGNHAHFTALANQQKKRPISLNEIQIMEPFIIDKVKEIISHGGIKETTLSLNILLGLKYCAHYQLDDTLINDIKFFNNFRNKLHFNAGIEFQLSVEFVERIKRVNYFVNSTLKRWIVRKYNWSYIYVLSLSTQKKTVRITCYAAAPLARASA